MPECSEVEAQMLYSTEKHRSEHLEPQRPKPLQTRFSGDLLALHGSPQVQLLSHDVDAAAPPGHSRVHVLPVLPARVANHVHHGPLLRALQRGRTLIQRLISRKQFKKR
ncbi:hypothetical protein EK904_001549 [Melospiza melodia maxima]|nr:hypothetical protein EK904_001549 [Melospiza melodia maxima]